MNPFEKYNFIAVEGNIGAGKTSFCNRIAEDFNCQVILESFEDNPFLQEFYRNPERYAFSVELFFMTERHKQLQEGLLKPELFKKGTISDYFFFKISLSITWFKTFMRLCMISNFHILRKLRICF